MQIKIEKRPLNKNEIILFEGIKTKKDDMAEVYIGLYIKAFEDDEEKTNINIQDEHGKTLLHHASVRGLEKTVLRLLEAGALVNIKDNEGLTPLIVAVDYLNFKQPLPDDALAQFSYKNSYGIIKALVKYGADITAKNQNGVTCLDIVVKNNNYHALVALLPPQTAITHITSINKNEFNLFYQTVFYGQTLMVNYFVNTLKIDINLQNPISGETALHYAVKGQQTEMIDLLIKNGANLAITDNNKESPQITSSTLPLSPTTPMPLKKPTILKEKSPLITFSTFSPSPTIPKALKKALIDGDVQKYIDKKLTTIEELITLQNENPWIISALRCLNIREGIYNNFITVADLAKLSEEQVASIKHTFSKEELKSQVDNFQEKNTPF